MSATGRKAVAPANREKSETTTAFMVLSVLTSSLEGTAEEKGRHSLQQGRYLCGNGTSSISLYKTREALLAWEYRGYRTGRRRS